MWNHIYVSSPKCWPQACKGPLHPAAEIIFVVPAQPQIPEHAVSAQWLMERGYVLNTTPQADVAFRSVASLMSALLAVDHTLLQGVATVLPNNHKPPASQPPQVTCKLKFILLEIKLTDYPNRSFVRNLLHYLQLVVVSDTLGLAIGKLSIRRVKICNFSRIRRKTEE